MIRGLLLLLLVYMPSFAQDHFFERKAEGWHWYENRDQGSDARGQKVQEPSQQIQDLRKDAEQKLYTAILKPTESNITAYLKAQKHIYDMSFKFGEGWQRTLINHPEFDETIRFPVTQVGRRAYLQQEQEKKEQAISLLSKQYGLFFFFRGDCTYCHKFAPIVHAFAQKYGWEVIALSVDGGTTEAFTNAQRDNGMAEKLSIHSYPTLLAYDTQSRQLIRICSGLISLQDIENRIELMTRGQK